jgi:NDP-sugar pyrophosphorylase family protein
VTLPSLALLAGGLATRLGERSKNTPKSLLPVAGHPFIHHQLRLLARLGIGHVVVCAGHLGQQIQDFTGDGSAYGLKVEYSFDGPRLLGTGGALKKALPLLSDPFFVLYGDSYLEQPLGPVLQAHQNSGKPALMTVFLNDGRYDSSNVAFSGGKIAAYDKSRRGPEMRHIDYGLGLLSKAALMAETEESFDLAAFYGKLVSQGQLQGFEVSQRFYEIGSAQGLEETDRYLSSP